MEQFDRLTQQSGVMGGKACIRGLCVTVGMIVGQIGAGHGVDERCVGLRCAKPTYELDRLSEKMGVLFPRGNGVRLHFSVRKAAWSNSIA
jgi:hypothetical protein